MNKSEFIGKLAEALAKAQGAIEGAKKDKANPFFKSKYADLASVWDACREPLSLNGLSVVQLPEWTEATVTVTTMLLHSSGEFISSTLAAAPKDTTPQSIGSLVTYLRRYSLAAIVGVAPDEDDDGNAASGRGAPAKPNGNGKPVVSQHTATTVVTATIVPPEEQLFIKLTEALPEAFVTQRDKDAWKELHKAEAHKMPQHLQTALRADFEKVPVRQ